EPPASVKIVIIHPTLRTLQLSSLQVTPVLLVTLLPPQLHMIAVRAVRKQRHQNRLQNLQRLVTHFRRARHPTCCKPARLPLASQLQLTRPAGAK
ncbi:MAG TPA: hypothetical protein VGW36_06485, partial [Pyrinomonadaceae bacterium]|nr:hypothetical protein [Pyrinomonadaceae bacterium]